MSGNWYPNQPGGYYDVYGRFIPIHAPVSGAYYGAPGGLRPQAPAGAYYGGVPPQGAYYGAVGGFGSQAPAGGYYGAVGGVPPQGTYYGTVGGVPPQGAYYGAGRGVGGPAPGAYGRAGRGVSPQGAYYGTVGGVPPQGAYYGAGRGVGGPAPGSYGRAGRGVPQQSGPSIVVPQQPPRAEIPTQQVPDPFGILRGVTPPGGQVERPVPPPINPPSAEQILTGEVNSPHNPNESNSKTLRHLFSRFTNEKIRVENNMREARWFCKERGRRDFLERLNRLRTALRTIREFEVRLQKDVMDRIRYRPLDVIKHATQLLRVTLDSLDEIDNQIRAINNEVITEEQNVGDAYGHFGPRRLPMVRVKPQLQRGRDRGWYVVQTKDMELDEVRDYWRNMYEQDYTSRVTKFYVRLSEFENSFSDFMPHIPREKIKLDEPYGYGLDRLKKKMYKALDSASGGMSFADVDERLYTMTRTEILDALIALGKSIDVMDTHMAELERMWTDFRQKANEIMPLGKDWREAEPEDWFSFGTPYTTRKGGQRRFTL